jgi:hypothetical protein
MSKRNWKRNKMKAVKRNGLQAQPARVPPAGRCQPHGPFGLCGRAWLVAQAGPPAWPSTRAGGQPSSPARSPGGPCSPRRRNIKGAVRVSNPNRLLPQPAAQSGQPAAPPLLLRVRPPPCRPQPPKSLQAVDPPSPFLIHHRSQVSGADRRRGGGATGPRCAGMAAGAAGLAGGTTTASSPPRNRRIASSGADRRRGAVAGS